MSDSYGHGGPNQNNGGHGDPSGYVIPASTPNEDLYRSLAQNLSQEDFRALTTSILLDRYRFTREHGITFGGLRDEYAILGYDRDVTNVQYWNEYRRGGIAGRIVDVFPNATWRGDMELIEDANKDDYTIFEQAWKDLDQRLQIKAKLLRVDKLSLLSTFAVLLLGAEGDLETELPRAKNPDDLLYLTPFGGGGGPGPIGALRERSRAIDADATIAEFDVDPTSSRFGLPLFYQLRRTDISSPLFQRPVHWTRVLHVADGLLDDEVYGMPALERVWNLLADLRKVTGGGAEAFWLRANQGLHTDVDKDLGTPDLAVVLEKLKEQSEEYKHQLTRWIRTKGTKVTTLGSDVANFDSPADAVLTQIAGSKGIPKRILTGSEMGELASSQDRDNWKDQVNGRQTGYAGPYIVRPLVDRLITYGYLPTPKKGVSAYEVRWPIMETLTAAEKVAGAQGWASVNSTQGSTVFTDEEIRDRWEGMAPLSEEQRAEIAKRNEEKIQQQQEAMTPQKPDEENFPRAAEGKFSSTQVMLPATLARRVLAFAATIPDEDLAEDGREGDPHVTVKYGITSNDPTETREALEGRGGIHLTLGKTSVFGSEDHEVVYIAVQSEDLSWLNKILTRDVETKETHPTYIPHITVAYVKPGLGQKYAGDARFEGMTTSIDTVIFSPAVGDPETIDLGATKITHFGENFQTMCGEMTRYTTMEQHDVSCPSCLQYMRAGAEFEPYQRNYEGLDEELVEVLAAAIEAEATEVIEEIIGVNRTLWDPDQPRD